MGNGAQLDLRRLRSRVSPSWAVWSFVVTKSDQHEKKSREPRRRTMRWSTEAQTAICQDKTQTVLCERPSLRFSVQLFYRKRRAPGRTSGIVGLLCDDQPLSTGDFQSGENHCCQNTRWKIVSPLRGWRTRQRGSTRTSTTTKHTDGAVEANPRNFGLSCLGAATRATGNQETLTRNRSPVPLGTVQK